MKKLILSLSAVLTLGTVMAQKTTHEPKAIPVQPSAMDIKQTDNSPVALTRDGVVVFQDDFSNGLSGTQGAWLPWDSSADTSIWMMANANSPAGAYSSSMAALASPTAANGWVIFDADFYQGGAITAANPAEDVSGWLQTPSIDCSQLTSVVVDFYQYFRYCCFSGSPITVEVSVDNGLNWTVFPGHGDFNPAANTITDNPHHTLVDISCVAANQSNVQVRFGFNTSNTAGYSHYFWGLDDVSVHSNPTGNDLEIVQVTNGDVFNIWEYRATPMEQHVLAADGGVLVGIIYRNSGHNDQLNANFNIDILDANGTVVHNQVENVATVPTYANAPECPAFINDTMYVSTNWEPSTLGDYTIHVSVAAQYNEVTYDTTWAIGSIDTTWIDNVNFIVDTTFVVDFITENSAVVDAIDETPANNTGVRAITFTQDEYGHDDTTLDVEMLNPEVDNSNPVQYEPTGFGTFYTFNYAGSTAYGITTLLGSTTDEGAYFNTVLYQATQGMNNTAPAPPLLTSSEWTVSPTMIGSTGGESYVYLPFNDPTEMLTSEVYFTGIVALDQSDLQITMLATGDTDTDNSTAQYQMSGGGDYLWFTTKSYSPAIRLIISNRVNVDEVNAEILSTFKMFPNPAKSNSTVQFELNRSSAVAYEVRNLEGKLMEYANLGTKAQGQHNLNLNVNNWPAGQYEVSLVIDGRSMYTRSLQVVK